MSIEAIVGIEVVWIGADRVVQFTGLALELASVERVGVIDAILLCCDRVTITRSLNGHQKVVLEALIANSAGLIIPAALYVSHKALVVAQVIIVRTFQTSLGCLRWILVNVGTVCEGDFLTLVGNVHVSRTAGHTSRLI